MAGKKETKASRDDRYVWKAGEAVLTDRNGRRVDPSTLEPLAKKPAAKPKKK